MIGTAERWVLADIHRRRLHIRRRSALVLPTNAPNEPLSPELSPFQRDDGSLNSRRGFARKQNPIRREEGEGDNWSMWWHVAAV